MTTQRFPFAVLIICLSVFFTASAQVPLGSFIGQNSLPSEDDPICTIPIYPEVSTELAEPLEGALVHDFKLYTIDGDSVQLSALMNDLKPVLLVGCNYTCYVFRGKMDVVNTMKAMYGDALDIYLVYTVEAHPVVDLSPYFGYENVGADNYAEGILYRQPTTYGERKAIVSDMLANMTINVPVLIDGPCNEFWSNWGTNPNPAWLIAPDGIVYDAQKWFNKEPEDMYASIDALLNIVDSGTYDPDGTFDAVIDPDAIFYGTVENTIAAHINFTNTSADDVLIDFVRQSVEVPAAWMTTLCTDLCYSPSEDSTTVYLAPGASQEVRVDFFTDAIPADGTVTVTCTNHTHPDNNFTYEIKAQSIAETAVEQLNPATGNGIYPNPVAANAPILLNYKATSVNAEYIVYDLTGNRVANGTLDNANVHSINNNLIPGSYYITILDNTGIVFAKFLVLD